MDKINTEKVNCNLCGNNDYDLLFENYDRLHKKPGIFNIVKCKNCELVYLNPRPRNTGKYYPDDYVPHNLPKEAFPESLTSKFINSKKYYKKNKSIIDRFFASIFERIYNPIPCCYSGRVLDIGCGSGIGLYNLKKHGWHVYGLDPSEKTVKFARKELGLNNVFIGTLEDKKYSVNFFDVIILNHVIEHLPDPKTTLNEIKRILRSGGLLLITTPNFSSLNAKFFRQFWFPLETPRHLYLFTPTTLNKLLNSVGLIRKKSSFSISSYSFAKSIGYLLGNKKTINETIMNFKVIFMPITLFLALIKRSDIFTFYVKKGEDEK